MKTKKIKEQNIFVISFIFFILFSTSFLVSYLLTDKIIYRKEAVSEKEEAGFLPNYLSSEEINNLYKENKNKNILILGYHQIRDILTSDNQKDKLFITPKDIFEKEMKYLYDNNYKSIFPSQYIEYLKDKNKIKLPNKSVIITFDDGYKSQIDIISILEKYNFKATFFLYKDCIGKYQICMDQKDINYLIEKKMKIANHTEHHIYMTDYKNNTIKKELQNNKEFLESFGFNNVENIMAYPYGIEDERIKDIVKEFGFIGAFGVSVFAKNKNDIWNIPRVLIGENIDNFYELFK